MRIVTAVSMVLIAAFVLTGCGTMHQAHHEPSGPKGSKYAPMVKWNNLAEGREIALREKKPLLVDFAVPEHCSRCEFLENNVYNRKVIVDKINAEFVPVWVNLAGDITTEEAKLGAAYDYKSDCLLLFLSHQGEILKDPEGEQYCFVDEIEPEVFMKYLDHIIDLYSRMG